MTNAISLTAADQDLHRVEGWGIFFADGSSQNDDGHSPYQLQRWDEAQQFDGDDDAWRHVHRAALGGSALHKRAILFLAAESIGEVEMIERTIPAFRAAAL
nr:hypothetical protein [uncultured Sphingomonas sp.]